MDGATLPDWIWKRRHDPASRVGNFGTRTNERRNLSGFRGPIYPRPVYCTISSADTYVDYVSIKTTVTGSSEDGLACRLYGYGGSFVHTYGRRRGT